MSSFTLPIVEALREPQIPHHYEPTLVVGDDWGTDFARVEPGEVDADVTLTAMEGGVLAETSLDLPWASECSRCTDPVRGTLELDLSDFYEAESGDRDDEDDEGLYHQGTELDLEPRLREEAVLALPLLPLCEPDCEGLCQECGKPWRELPDDHAHEQVDPRLAGLAALLEGRNVQEGQDD